MLVVYVQDCASGTLPMADCGPVWQLGLIAFLLVCAVISLVVLRVASRAGAARA
jgi:hypothetical protein